MRLGTHVTFTASPMPKPGPNRNDLPTLFLSWKSRTLTWASPALPWDRSPTPCATKPPKGFLLLKSPPIMGMSVTPRIPFHVPRVSLMLLNGTARHGAVSMLARLRRAPHEDHHLHF